MSGQPPTGAVLVEVTLPEGRVIVDLEDLVLRVEFKAGVNAYLASTAPAQVKTRTLADLTAFNAAEPRETALFGQEAFLEAQASPGLDDPAYLKAKADAKRLAGPQGIDKLLSDARVEVLVAESGGPTSVVDRISGGRWLGSPSTLPAVAGYPPLTVPMGLVEGLPVGLSFMGTAWSEARLLSLGYAFEQATKARRAPTFPATVNGSPAFDPQ